MLGSVQLHNPGTFNGKGFECSNHHHIQLKKEVQNDKCLLRKTSGKLKRMKASKAIQLGLCRSAGGFVFAPTENVIQTSTKQIARLTMFIVVIGDWIDFKNHLVIVPHSMPFEQGDNVHTSSLKNIFTLAAEDHDFFKPDDFVGKDWVEYSFNNCTGPIVSFADAVSIRNVFNQIFVNDLYRMKKIFMENPNIPCQ